MSEKNSIPTENFRFNNSRINQTNKTVPSTIDWNSLKNNLKAVSGTENSLWGIVKNQQKQSKEDKNK